MSLSIQNVFRVQDIPSIATWLLIFISSNYVKRVCRKNFQPQIQDPRCQRTGLYVELFEVESRICMIQECKQRIIRLVSH